MKINNFPFLRKIQYATPEEIVYEPYKNDLEEIWDKMCKDFEKKIQIEQSEQIENLKLRNKILLAKVEIEIAKKNYDLIKDNVLTIASAEINKKETICLKKDLIKETVKIIEKQKELLLKVYKEEEHLFNLIKKYKKYKIKIFNDHLRIYGNKNTFLTVKEKIENKNLIPKGLNIEIKYKNKIYKAQQKPNITDDPVQQMMKYIKEQEMVQKINKGEITIEINNNINNNVENDPIALFVLKSIHNNIEINKIIEKIF
ncbi:hypothetical protein SLOPH_1778, partial [Spraguea lophii 42_110]